MVMCHSQECEWPEALLSSYYNDLVTARREERNLMTEKYAWMMESTFPEEFCEIAHLLPEIDETTSQRIEEIVAVDVDWNLALREKYPRLANKGRTVRTSEDSRYNTSFETYLRGELKTCSSKTVALLHEFTMFRKAGGVNCAERELLNQVRSYGFATLEEAEEHQ